MSSCATTARTSQPCARSRRGRRRKNQTWLDEDEITPGTSWQDAIGQQIKSIKSAAIFVGKSGIGPWQNEEIQAFLGQFMERKCPVIPTISGFGQNNAGAAMDAPKPSPCGFPCMRPGSCVTGAGTDASDAQHHEPGVSGELAVTNWPDRKGIPRSAESRSSPLR